MCCLRVKFAVSPIRRSVALGEGHQLQHVEGVFPASNILVNVLNSTSFSDGQMKSENKNERKGKRKKGGKSKNEWFLIKTYLM